MGAQVVLTRHRPGEMWGDRISIEILQSSSCAQDIDGR